MYTANNTRRYKKKKNFCTVCTHAVRCINETDLYIDHSTVITRSKNENANSNMQYYAIPDCHCCCFRNDSDGPLPFVRLVEYIDWLR